MNKHFVILLLICAYLPNLLGQAELAMVKPIDTLETSAVEIESPEDTIILLDDRQLKAQKWYYDLAEAYRDRENVYKLSLAGQRLTEVPPQVFAFPNLQYLNLGDNKIRELPAQIGDLKHLEQIYLTKNKLKTLPITLKDLPHLTHFYIGTNKLMEIPAWFGGLSKLRVLEISFNPVTDYEVGLLQEKLPKVDIKH